MHLAVLLGENTDNPEGLDSEEDEHKSTDENQLSEIDLGEQDTTKIPKRSKRRARSSSSERNEEIPARQMEKLIERVSQSLSQLQRESTFSEADESETEIDARQLFESHQKTAGGSFLPFPSV